MEQYKKAGVDIQKGDEASRIAFSYAQQTFNARKGIGAPLAESGGFSGALDFGSFLLIQNSDGVGSKMLIAHELKKYETLGYDLCAMVADDAICLGAEVCALTNTFDVPKVEKEMIAACMKGLAEVCKQEQIVIIGGEIAELPHQTTSPIWNANALGVLDPKKKLPKKEDITAGMALIGLKDPGLRSNGLTLARKKMEALLGANWTHTPWKEGKTFGEALLTPSKVFHRLLLDTVLNAWDAPPFFPIFAIAHITGGGIPGNLKRVLPPGYGAMLDNLHQPPEILQWLQEEGNISEEECYHVWHSGTAMMLIAEEKDAKRICEVLNSKDNTVDAKIVGHVIQKPHLILQSQYKNREEIIIPL